MATKSVYQDFDTDALTHFGLDSAPLYGVLTSSGVINVLATQDETTYDNIVRLLSVPTETDQTFINKKKAFILPRCNVSQDRLKAALKEHKITVTNDYTLADLIIGHEEISGKFQHGQNIPSTYMAGKLWNMEAVSSTNGYISEIDNHSNHVIVTEKVTDKVRYYNLDVEDSLYDEWMLTGMAINLAHKIDTTSVSVVDTETVLHASANKITLDEQMVELLVSQLNSYNNEDLDLAAKIIPTINYTKNIHLLWDFAQKSDSDMHKISRNKDVEYWKYQSDFATLTRSSAEDMILMLEEENKLSSLEFKFFEPLVRKEIQISNRNLYTFKVQVKPEYLKYLKKEKNEIKS